MGKDYASFKSDDEAFNSLSEKNKQRIMEFIRECSIKSKSKKRGSNRKRALIRFLTYLNKDYTEIGYNDYVGVSEAISNSSLGVYAKNGERDFIKRFLRDSFQDADSFFKKFKFLASEKKPEEDKLKFEDLLSEEDLNKMLKVTSSIRDKALIVLAYESAGRPEELLKLKWNDVDFKKGLVYLYSIKTKRKRAIPIKNALPHLERLMKENEMNEEDYAFISSRNNKLCSASFNFLLDNLAKRAGIKKRVFPYVFRHTRLNLLIRKLSPKAYEDISGHSLEMGLRTYAHLNQDKNIEEMNERIFEVKELTPEEKDELSILRKEQDQTKKILSELMKKINKIAEVQKPIVAEIQAKRN